MTAINQGATKPFVTLIAADLMSAPVMTIPEVTPLREAARMLSRCSISGAPVVDADGRCVGVLSTTDFVTWAGEDHPAGKKKEPTTFIAPWGELINIDESADEEIRRYMTARPVTVPPTAPVGELARRMAEAHIHRVLVVSADNRPQGIVTSTDVLAAVGRDFPQVAPAAPVGAPHGKARSKSRT
jgi:CBS domain-containing protein